MTNFLKKRRNKKMEKNYSLLLTEKEIDLIKSSLNNSAAKVPNRKGEIFMNAMGRKSRDYMGNKI
jgi:uncharacterized C2H2 Zn-finger protein